MAIRRTDLGLQLIPQVSDPPQAEVERERRALDVDAIEFGIQLIEEGALGRCVWPVGLGRWPLCRMRIVPVFASAVATLPFGPVGAAMIENRDDGLPGRFPSNQTDSSSCP